MGTLMKFRREERKSTIMGRLARGYRITELRLISDYLSAKRWGSAGVTPNWERVEKARKIHHELCEECHKEEGKFQDKEIPRIAGQWPQYLYLQLLDYSTGDQKMPQPPKMKERLEPLNEQELMVLSEFYGSRK